MRPLLRPHRPGDSVVGILGTALDRQFPPKRSQRSFMQWIEERRRDGLKVDGKPFTWDGYEPLRAVYEAIGSSQEVYLIKAAQMGATICELLSICWRADEWPGTSHGFYFPTRNDVAELSRLRFRPLVEQLGGSVSTEQQKGVKSTMVVQIGSNPIYMRYMKGDVSKDSIPLDSITFDEIRLMEETDVDQAKVRIEGSRHQWILGCSTAGYPDCDIDRLFQLGTQTRWLTQCEACGVEICMALEWPRCIAVDRQEPLEARYICTRCGKTINPQHGHWVSAFPDRPIKSFHLHSMLRAHNSATRLWGIWQKTTNKPEFYRAFLGIPYLGADALPLSLDYLRRHGVDQSIRWMPRSEKQDSYLGADQRGGELHVVIQGAHESTREADRLRHVEIVQSEDPWVRLEELMDVYRVDVAVIDALPSKNESFRFAQKYPGRVFLAFYDTDPKTADLAKWGDKPKESVFVRKADPETKYKWTVRIARTLALSFAIDLWRHGKMFCPEPEALTQDIRAFGRMERMSPVDTRHANLASFTLFKHLCSIAREIEVDPDTQVVKKVTMINVGLDPHFLHAYAYSCVAASRAGARPTFLRPDPVPGKSVLDQLVVDPTAPAQPDEIGAFLTQMGKTRVSEMEGEFCGNCKHFKARENGKGDCTLREFIVGEAEIRCDFYARRG